MANYLRVHAAKTASLNLHYVNSPPPNGVTFGRHSITLRFEHSQNSLFYLLPLITGV
jgi:hypothetical protein